MVLYRPGKQWYSFMKAGWVCDLRAHLFKYGSDERVLVMGKVCLHIFNCVFIGKCDC